MDVSANHCIRSSKLTNTSRSFILEGIVTVVMGSTLRWTLPDSPASASFLTAREKAFIERRLMQDAGTKSGHVNMHDGFKWHYLRAALTEWKIYLAVRGPAQPQACF